MRINIKRVSLLLAVFATLYVGVMHYQATVDSINITKEMESYSELIAEEKAKNEEYKRIEENLNTTDSYETIARDDLGMLKSDETVYINPETK
ncbi:MAG: hypothetical protein E7411_03665 [Ruminococcaceae bacterium]|nr:hypothetical protein [Oscillospiraceae bacterium]